MSRLYRGRKMLERTLLEYARKYGYIRGGAEPAKMRSRKDETKGRKKKDAEPGDENEIQELEADEEASLFADDDIELEIEEEEEPERFRDRVTTNVSHSRFGRPVVSAARCVSSGLVG